MGEALRLDRSIFAFKSTVGLGLGSNAESSSKVSKRGGGCANYPV